MDYFISHFQTPFSDEKAKCPWHLVFSRPYVIDTLISKINDQDVGAASVILHPNYYAGALFNDVAIIVLKTVADVYR